MPHRLQGSIRLRAAKAGETVRVVRLEGQEPVCRRQREMGFCEMASVRVLATAGGLVCQVCGARVGLSGRLAESIVVSRPAA